MDLLRPLRALGMMSGSSLDGVNAAVITTDGVDIGDFGVRGFKGDIGFIGVIGFVGVFGD